jgi:hypothetical protein
VKLSKRGVLSKWIYGRFAKMNEEYDLFLLHSKRKTYFTCPVTVRSKEIIDR